MYLLTWCVWFYSSVAIETITEINVVGGRVTLAFFLYLNIEKKVVLSILRNFCSQWLILVSIIQGGSRQREVKYQRAKIKNFWIFFETDENLENDNKYKISGTRMLFNALFVIISYLIPLCSDIIILICWAVNFFVDLLSNFRSMIQYRRQWFQPVSS